MVKTFHTLKLKNDKIITQEAKNEYEKLYPTLIKELDPGVLDNTSYNIGEETVRFDVEKLPTEEGYRWNCVDAKGKSSGEFFLLPSNLSSTFYIGWSREDLNNPRSKIAEKLVEIIKNNAILSDFFKQTDHSVYGSPSVTCSPSKTPSPIQYRYEYERDYDDYYDGYDEWSPGSDDDYAPDYTACSASDCGYCGKCDY